MAQDGRPKALVLFLFQNTDFYITHSVFVPYGMGKARLSQRPYLPAGLHSLSPRKHFIKAGGCLYFLLPKSLGIKEVERELRSLCFWWYLLKGLNFLGYVILSCGEVYRSNRQ